MTLAAAMTCLALVAPAARAHGVSPTLAAAVAHVESGCGQAGANVMGVHRPSLDAWANVRRGVRILARLQRQLPLRSSLRVYHHGRRPHGACQYPARVLRAQRAIERLMARGGGA